jgi:hypothetical protein
MFARRRQGKAEPRWGWSGVAPLIAVRLSAPGIDLQSLLPGHQSSDGQIIRAIGDLGAKYHRYLHQDEFGPTRAQRMAALRLLLHRFELLVSRLHGLPEDLRLPLSAQIARCASAVAPDVDNYQAYRGDIAAVQQIGEAAVDVERLLHMAPTTRDVGLMAGLNDAAQRAAELLSALDATTGAAVALDSDCPALEIGADVATELIDVATVSARITRLQYRVEQVLARFEQRRGPERGESLRWLVWRLCDLYHSETGRRVTNSAVDASRCNYTGTNYTGAPQSPAGRFVLAAVQALHPSEAWAREADHWLAQRRARILNKHSLPRAVYFAMRDYVAHHRRVDVASTRRRTSNFVN